MALALDAASEQHARLAGAILARTVGVGYRYCLSGAGSVPAYPSQQRAQNSRSGGLLMSANPTIFTVLLPFLLGGSGLSQSSSSTLPTSPAAQSLFVAAVPPESNATPPHPADSAETPPLLTPHD